MTRSPKSPSAALAGLCGLALATSAQVSALASNQTHDHAHDPALEHEMEHEHAATHAGHASEDAGGARSGPTATPLLTAELEAALAAGASLVTVDVLGVVCDFCAIAMTKTFGRRDEVAATQVDLDTKTLLIAVRQGAVLDDASIESLVKRAGYNTAAIHRGETTGAEPIGGEHAPDAP